MLELDDIQYILVTRVPALTGRYEFLSFREPAQGRAWLQAIREKVPSAKAVADAVNLEKRWVSVAFTWNGLRALGADEASLATFPEEFRQGMAARWQVIGDTGTNHPDNWIGGLAGPQLHAIAILFARDAATREQSVREHRAFLARTPGVEVLSSLDLEAIPPFDHVREHSAQAAPTAAAARHVTVAMASGNTAAPRSRPVAAAAPHAPLVIAQTGQIEPVEAPARDPDSFLSKTIDLKDHVVAATQRVVTTIGSIPSWIGERIGGSTVNSPPVGRLASASW
jgi:DyP dimeric alpha+beta barrel domain